MIPDFSSLIPAVYENFRPLIREALEYFFAELSPARRSAIVAEQLAIGTGATLYERLVTFLQQCPTLHKVGQILARHPALDPALREQLQRLESLPPTLSMSELRPLIDAALGADAERIQLAGEPLAEGSVAIVVPFDMVQPGDNESTHGVLKVLKPEVVDLIEEELNIAGGFGEWLEQRSAELGLPKLAYRDTIDQVARMLRAEISFDVERRNLAAAAEFYSVNRHVRVPRLLPFHGPGVTAMERIEGQKVTDVADLSPNRQRRLAQRLVVALLAQPFFDDSDGALFHGDPHAGNLFLDPNGQVVIIDWSLTARMDRATRHAIINVLVGAFTLNSNRVKQGLRSLIVGRFDEDRLDAEVARAMDSVPWNRLPGFEWLLGLLDGLAFAGAEFEPQLIVFRKALFTLHGVFADISKDYSIDLPLARTAVLQFYRELGPRLLNVSGRKRFGIQLNNIELMTLGMLWPVTLSRYWLAGLGYLGRRMTS